VIELIDVLPQSSSYTWADYDTCANQTKQV